MIHAQISAFAHFEAFSCYGTSRADISRSGESHRKSKKIARLQVSLRWRLRRKYRWKRAAANLERRTRAPRHILDDGLRIPGQVFRQKLRDQLSRRVGSATRARSDQNGNRLTLEADRRRCRDSGRSLRPESSKKKRDAAHNSLSQSHRRLLLQRFRMA
jgi:hypothetical protein